jgi:hypothetical protein
LSFIAPKNCVANRLRNPRLIRLLFTSARRDWISVVVWARSPGWAKSYPKTGWPPMRVSVLEWVDALQESF